MVAIIKTRLPCQMFAEAFTVVLKLSFFEKKVIFFKRMTILNI